MARRGMSPVLQARNIFREAGRTAAATAMSSRAFVSSPSRLLEKSSRKEAFQYFLRRIQLPQSPEKPRTVGRCLYHSHLRQQAQTLDRAGAAGGLIRDGVFKMHQETRRGDRSLRGASVVNDRKAVCNPKLVNIQGRTVLRDQNIHEMDTWQSGITLWNGESKKMQSMWNMDIAPEMKSKWHSQRKTTRKTSLDTEELSENGWSSCVGRRRGLMKGTPENFVVDKETKIWGCLNDQLQNKCQNAAVEQKKRTKEHSVVAGAHLRERGRRCLCGSILYKQNPSFHLCLENLQKRGDEWAMAMLKGSARRARLEDVQIVITHMLHSLFNRFRTRRGGRKDSTHCCPSPTSKNIYPRARATAKVVEKPSLHFELNVESITRILFGKGPTINTVTKRGREVRFGEPNRGFMDQKQGSAFNAELKAIVDHYVVAWAQVEGLQGLRECIRKMEYLGLRADTSTYNLVLQGEKSRQDRHFALSVLRAMEETSVEREEKTYSLVLRAFASDVRATSESELLCFFRKLEQDSVILTDVVICTQVILLFVRRDLRNQAISLFEALQETKTGLADPALYRCMIRVYCEEEENEVKAHALLEKLKYWGDTDKDGARILISGSSDRQARGRSEARASRQPRNRAECHASAFNCILKLHVQKNRLAKVAELVHEMLELKVEPNAETFEILTLTHRLATERLVSLQKDRQNELESVFTAPRKGKTCDRDAGSARKLEASVKLENGRGCTLTEAQKWMEKLAHIQSRLRCLA